MGKEPPAGEAAPTGRALAATVIKWLVPTVSALFVTVGYVIVSAHENLLGVYYHSFRTSDYIANAAAFLYDLFTILPDAALGILTFSRFPSYEASEFLLLVLICSTSIALIVYVRRARDLEKGPALLHYGLVAALALLIFTKFVYYDAPLARVEKVLGENVPLETRLEALSHGSWLEKPISDRAMKLWAAMVYSRVSQQNLLFSNRQGLIKASIERDDARKMLRDLFLAHSLLSTLLGAAALSILGATTRPGVAAIALIEAAYVLTLPYAYGKLEKETTYRYGHVIFEPDVVAPIQTEGTEPTPVERERVAIVLENGESSRNLLVLKESDCRDDGGVVQKMREVKLWEVVNSRIVAVKEIYPEDIIKWKLLNETGCPEAAKVTAAPPLSSAPFASPSFYPQLSMRSAMLKCLSCQVLSIWSTSLVSP